MYINNIKMNINGIDVVTTLERHDNVDIINALNRKCARHFVEVHNYIHNNIYMFDYPIEDLFDDSIFNCTFCESANFTIFLEGTVSNLKKDGFIGIIHSRDHGDGHIHIVNPANKEKEYGELFITSELPEKKEDLRFNYAAKSASQPKNLEYLDEIREKIIDWAKKTYSYNVDGSVKTNWDNCKELWVQVVKSNAHIFKGKEFENFNVNSFKSKNRFYKTKNEFDNKIKLPVL